MLSNRRIPLGEFLGKSQLPGTLCDQLGVETFGAKVLFNRFLHSGERMIDQELQHADVMPSTGVLAVSLFQTLPQVLKDGWQLPAAIDVGVIQSSRPPLQSRQIMQRIEHLLVRLIAAFVPGNSLAGDDDLDVIDVALHRCGLKGVLSRHAITDLVEASSLVFVDLGLLIHAGIEASCRQW